MGGWWPARPPSPVGSPVAGVSGGARTAGISATRVSLPAPCRSPASPPRSYPNDPDIPIPVAFSPPEVPVAEAGLLIDGQVDARETAATIIDLAVLGALMVQSSVEDEFM